MPEYRIDRLSELSGVSVRNIRVYQDRGLLAPPSIKGRVGWYSDAHLIRLNLISRMLERGYTFATISELLTAARDGLSVENLLQRGERPGMWRTVRRAVKITAGEFRNSFGGKASDEDLALGARLGLLVKEGPNYIIADPQFLESAERLVDAGFSLATVLKRWERVRSDIGDAASTFVAMFTERYLADEGVRLDLAEGEVHDVADLISAMRPIAANLVAQAFYDALDEAISAALVKVTEQLGIDE